MTEEHPYNETGEGKATNDVPAGHDLQNTADQDEIVSEREDPPAQSPSRQRDEDSPEITR